jgi:hypothetical protein
LEGWFNRLEVRKIYDEDNAASVVDRRSISNWQGNVVLAALRVIFHGSIVPCLHASELTSPTP